MRFFISCILLKILCIPIFSCFVVKFYYFCELNIIHRHIVINCPFWAEQMTDNFKMI